MAEKKTEKKVEAAAAKPRVSRKEVKAARREAKRPAGPHATLRYLGVTPRKVRLVANEVRGMKVGDALALLSTRRRRRRTRSPSCCARRSRTPSRRAATSTSTRSS